MKTNASGNSRTSATRATSLVGSVSRFVILFAVFSFAGWLYETIENVLSFGGLYLRSALMLPWCPIYGIGGIIIVVIMTPLLNRLGKRMPKPALILVTIVALYVLTAAIELAGSYVCEAITGVVPWDYSHAWANFDGRIAPAYTVRFVVLGLIALFVVDPLVKRFVQTKPRAARIVAAVIVVLFVFDVAFECMGYWGAVKDSLVPYGVHHW